MSPYRQTTVSENSVVQSLEAEIADRLFICRQIYLTYQNLFFPGLQPEDLSKLFWAEKQDACWQVTSGVLKENLLQTLTLEELKPNWQDYNPRLITDASVFMGGSYASDKEGGLNSVSARNFFLNPQKLYEYQFDYLCRHKPNEVFRLYHKLGMELFHQRQKIKFLKSEVARLTPRDRVLDTKLPLKVHYGLSWGLAAISWVAAYFLADL